MMSCWRHQASDEQNTHEQSKLARLLAAALAGGVHGCVDTYRSIAEVFPIYRSTGKGLVMASSRGHAHISKLATEQGEHTRTEQSSRDCWSAWARHRAEERDGDRPVAAGETPATWARQGIAGFGRATEESLRLLTVFFCIIYVYPYRLGSLEFKG